MTQEEKENYYAVLEFNLDGVTYISKISKLNFPDMSTEMKLDYIKFCLKEDMKALKKKLNEVPKVSDNLDSE